MTQCLLIYTTGDCCFAMCQSTRQSPICTRQRLCRVPQRRICRYDEARSLIIPVPQFCQLLKDGDKGCWHQWTVVLTPVDLLPMRNGPDRRLQPKHFEECTVHPKKNLTCGGLDRPHGIVLRRRLFHTGQENPRTSAPTLTQGPVGL